MFQQQLFNDYFSVRNATSYPKPTSPGCACVFAVSVFKEWAVHHCSSSGDIFCLKFNLHLFQRCHKNAYKEQAHDMDLQWLHSPHTTVAFQGLYRQAGDNSQDYCSREGKGCPCLHVGKPVEKDICSLVHHRVSPSPQNYDGDHHMVRTLWGIQCLLEQCWSPSCLGHLPPSEAPMACCPDGKH